MLNLNEEKLESSLGLITKHFSNDFIESTVGLGQTLNNGEGNQLNEQALAAWKKVQNLYNEAVPVVTAYMEETKKVYNVAEYLRTRFNAGEVSNQSIDESVASIDADAVMFS